MTHDPAAPPIVRSRGPLAGVPIVLPIAVLGVVAIGAAVAWWWPLFSMVAAWWSA